MRGSIKEAFNLFTPSFGRNRTESDARAALGAELSNALIGGHNVKP